MEDTQALHHQQQLEHQLQQLEEKEALHREMNNIAYRCLGVAQSMKDLRAVGNADVLLLSEKRLIELATEYEALRERLLK
jgi:hypothetical protein